MNKLLSWVIYLYGLKLGLSEWKWMKQFTDENMDVQHSRITQKFGGSLGAAPWLLLSETASEKLSWEGFWDKIISWIWLDISLLRNSLNLYGMFLRSFLRRKHIWMLFLRNKYLVIWVLPLLLQSVFQSEEDLWGTSGWKLLDLTSVSRLLAYVKILIWSIPRIIVPQLWNGQRAQYWKNVIFLQPPDAFFTTHQDSKLCTNLDWKPDMQLCRQQDPLDCGWGLSAIVWNIDRNPNSQDFQREKNLCTTWNIFRLIYKKE